MFLVYYGAGEGERRRDRAGRGPRLPQRRLHRHLPRAALHGAGGSARAARRAGAALRAVRHLPRARRPHRLLLPGPRAARRAHGSRSTARSSTGPSPHQLEEITALRRQLVRLRRVVTPQRDLLARGHRRHPRNPRPRSRLAQLLPRRLRPRDPDLRPDRLLPRPPRRHPRRLPLGRLQPAQPDHQAADRGGDDLPAALLRRRFLRPELQVDGDQHRQRAAPSSCSGSAAWSSPWLGLLVWFRRGSYI